jgi:alpha/beta superfamily hydrolase
VAEQRKLWIEGPAGRLEAALRVACPARAAAVVAHPHPLHGGTLHNPVVFHTDRELARAGWTTLRFNFRGVGTSDGTHDEGRGEVGDLGAAVNWLRGAARGVPLLVVGYSFGSRCALRHALGDVGVAAVIAIGFPVGLEDLSAEVRALGRPFAVVQGTRDEFGDPEQVRATIEGAEPAPELFTIEGADHLFTGRAGEAAAAVVFAAEALLQDRISR